jgi:hypothetical protein
LVRSGSRRLRHRGCT